MKESFFEELGFIRKSAWFWAGSAVYFIAEIFFNIQTVFDGGVLHYYQFSFNAQYLVVLFVVFLLALSYFSAADDADITRFPTVKRLWGKVAADSLVSIMVIFIVSFPKFVIVEMINGGFEEPGIALFCTFCYFYFFLCKTVFLVVAAALIGRCFYTLMGRMPFTSIIVYSMAAFLSLPLAGVYADMMHSVLENKLAGPYAEALASNANETHFILTWDVLLSGLFALTVIFLFFLFTLKMTNRVFRIVKETYENCHYVKE